MKICTRKKILFLSMYFKIERFFGFSSTPPVHVFFVSFVQQEKPNLSCVFTTKFYTLLYTGWWWWWWRMCMYIWYIFITQPILTTTDIYSLFSRIYIYMYLYFPSHLKIIIINSNIINIMIITFRVFVFFFGYKYV